MTLCLIDLSVCGVEILASKLPSARSDLASVYIASPKCLYVPQDLQERASTWTAPLQCRLSRIPMPVSRRLRV